MIWHKLSAQLTVWGDGEERSAEQGIGPLSVSQFSSLKAGVFGGGEL